MAAASSSGLENIELEEQRESLACDGELSSPFLVRFHAGHFRIILSFSSSAFLWRTIRESSIFRAWISKVVIEAEMIHVTIWILSLFFLISLSLAYIAKCFFNFEVVKREYMDRIKSNYLFAPSISAIFQVLAFPRFVHSVSTSPCVAVLLMIPVLILELKIYGQWFLGGKTRMLCRVANPATNISVVGNFLGAVLAAQTGWKEIAIVFFSIGLWHYAVLFVTLYQKLPSSLQLPKELHPVYFLFIATPSSAGIAWESISGAFGYVSKMPFFLALFHFMSLVVRVNLFRGLRYSVAWWAAAFPLNMLAVASIIYAEQNFSLISKVMATFFAVTSNIVLLALSLSTVVRITRSIVTCEKAPGKAVTSTQKTKEGPQSQSVSVETA